MAWRELLHCRVLRGKTGEPSPVELPQFLLANVPLAVDWTGHMIHITDATPQCLAFSDGTNWIATDDGTTAA